MLLLNCATATAATPRGSAAPKTGPARNAVAVATPATVTKQQPVTVALNSISPRSPDARRPEQVVRIRATLVNNSDNTYADVRFGIQRGLPITQQNLLDAAIANPPETGYSVPSPLDLRRQLLPHARLVVNYQTTSADLCLCFGGVYPYALVATAATTAGGDFTEVGRSQLFIPSFLQQPQPVSVSWVWPLLDRPHRSIDTDVFTDEGLAGEVASGGRLDRALRVAELLAGKVRLTLVVDPDLLDSLAVMTRPQGYRVRSGTGTVPGTGGVLATAWLQRFKAVEAQHDVVLTGYADPDVNALTRAGMPFSTALDPQVKNRIGPYLGSNLSNYSLAWPAGGALTSKALDALVGSGASTVLLSDAALPGGNKTEPRPDALAPLPTAAGSADALVTDSALEATIRRALKPGSTSYPAEIQTMLGQLAIRAAQQPDKRHFVVLSPDRYVDTAPAAAAALIQSVLGTGWSGAISIPTALSTVVPVDHGPLDTAAENPNAEVSQQQLASLSQIAAAVNSMSEALHDNDAAAQLLAGFNTGIQRGSSSAWRADPAGGADVVGQLQSRIAGITGAVHLVTPAVGSYSLSSSNSPIVVTVSNQLAKPVTIRVMVTAVKPGIGFTASPVNEVVPAQSIETIRIPTHVERLGKFQVVATLQTPDGRQLGQVVPLNVRATAIGSVTKIITVVAVAILLLALVRRLVRRIRRGPAPKSGLAATTAASAAA
jgi:hypothetical protein